MSSPGSPPLRSADEALTEAEQYLARARSASVGGEMLALVGIGNVLVALVKQQREFYREVADLLDTARGDAPEA